MEADNLQARIQHEIADLRARCPRISICHATLEDWHEGAAARFALVLDIRWPQHQSLIAGPPRCSAGQAIEDGFGAAARSVGAAHA